MVITYCGMAFVKVQFGDTVVAFNPFGKLPGLKETRFGADVALVSMRDKAFSETDNLVYGERQPFIVSGPGEYEVKGIYVKGVATPGKDDKINTAYSLTLDGINICHLGGINKTTITADAQEQLGEIDILFVPVGDGMLTPEDAEKIATTLEPKMIVPLYAMGEGKKDDETLAKFMKELGAEKVAPVDKLTLKKKDLEGKEGDVVILSPSE